MRTTKSPAMVPAPAVAVGAPAITGAIMCAVSLVASARPLRIELPKISLPKIPEIKVDLPLPGKKKEAASPKPSAPRAPPGTVKVRAAEGVVPAGSGGEAPTLAEVTGQVTVGTIKTEGGYKKFPERRMPGANMDGWKKIAKDITPQI